MHAGLGVRWLLGVAMVGVLETVARGGSLNVGGGVLVNGSCLAVDSLYVASNSVLCGNGSISGALVVAGTLSPGLAGAGTQYVAGTVGFLPGSVYACDVPQHTLLDRLVVTGPVTGSCRVVFAPSGTAFPLHQPIIAGSGSGSFAGFAAADPWTWRLETTGSLTLAVTHLRGDSDGDALPDWWEFDYFGGRTNALPQADGDVDDTDNHTEYIANTDPRNPASVFELVSMSREANGNEVICWRTAPGRRYFVLVHTNLPRSGWNTVAVVHAYSQPEHAVTNDATTSGCEFYEITVQEEEP